MSTYAIGDIQGCYQQLNQLLDLINFSPESDMLWFVGDLVNRGPQSLEVLRYIMSLQDRAVTVLGNHDIHLIATVLIRGKARKKDSFNEIMHAPDRDEIIYWLRQQPLFHHDEQSGYSMLHAGVAPQWDLAQIKSLAAEVQEALSGDNHLDYLAGIYGNEPAVWSNDLEGADRLRCITNYFTRLRFCDQNGVMEFSEKGPPGSQADPWVPWYAVKDRQSANLKILFGHWSTHQAAKESSKKHQVYPLDTGCLWGGELTAMRLDDQQLFRLDCSE